MLTRQFFSRLILLVAVPFFPTSAKCQVRPVAGHHRSIQVQAETRLDWIFGMANQSLAEIPANLLGEYDSTAQSYELFVPQQANAKQPSALVLFISPGNKSSGWNAWRKVCEQRGILFAGPHAAGNNCPQAQRVRIVMDVLDDVRRRFAIDADRTYVSGFSGGGRIACQLGFSLPEYFGGVVPICAAGDLRQESWLRQRVTDRLSVALLTGENDFNRSEVERYRGPILQELGVRTKIWVFPKLGHGLPKGNQLGEVFTWLEDGLKSRQAFAKRYPASRMNTGKIMDRQTWATALFTEASGRLEKKETVYSGLMQMKGIRRRWPDLPEAEKALAVLGRFDGQPDRSWELQDIAEQRKSLIAQARGLTAYATGPLPKQYAANRAEWAKTAVQLWAVVLQDGQDKKAVAEARDKIPELQKIAEQK